jgi:hypothetical protein
MLRLADGQVDRAQGRIGRGAGEQGAQLLELVRLQPLEKRVQALPAQPRLRCSANTEV